MPRAVSERMAAASVLLHEPPGDTDKNGELIKIFSRNHFSVWTAATGVP